MIFMCKIFGDDGLDVPLADLFYFEIEQDIAEFNSIARCPHCELPLDGDEACREGRCFSHDYHADGELKEGAAR